MRVLPVHRECSKRSFGDLDTAAKQLPPHHCRAWKKMKTEEKARKTGLEAQLKKTQLAQLDKININNLMVAVTQAALQQQQPPPMPAPQFTQAPAIPFPPQPYGNPQPYLPTLSQPPVCWYCGVAGHMRNMCPNQWLQVLLGMNSF